mmetsp:Transcript_11792/g.42172  ORF Transcript_11792/g.42172 Transcript_11792/m.42172 type:complete len:359 (+) Transcript_11792:1095-2171(+)
MDGLLQYRRCAHDHARTPLGLDHGLHPCSSPYPLQRLHALPLANRVPSVWPDLKRVQLGHDTRLPRLVLTVAHHHALQEPEVRRVRGGGGARGRLGRRRPLSQKVRLPLSGGDGIQSPGVAPVGESDTSLDKEEPVAGHVPCEAHAVGHLLRVRPCRPLRRPRVAVRRPALQVRGLVDRQGRHHHPTSERVRHTCSTPRHHEERLLPHALRLPRGRGGSGGGGRRDGEGGSPLPDGNSPDVLRPASPLLLPRRPRRPQDALWQIGLWQMRCKGQPTGRRQRGRQTDGAILAELPAGGVGLVADHIAGGGLGRASDRSLGLEEGHLELCRGEPLPQVAQLFGSRRCRSDLPLRCLAPNV